MRTLVSSAIMQLISRGKLPVREELHAGDSRLQTSHRCGSILVRLLDGFDDHTDALLLAQLQVGCGLENSVRVDGLSDPRHRLCPLPSRLPLPRGWRIRPDALCRDVCGL